jgi:hypothetical protein
MKRFCRKKATPGYTWVGLNVFRASSLNITYSPNRIQHEPIRALHNHPKRIKTGLWIRTDLMWIRIQFFSNCGSGSRPQCASGSGSRSQCGSGSGSSSRSRVLIDQKFENIYSWEFYINIFFLKNCNYLSPGLPKGRPSYRRSLQPSKENIQHYQNMKILNFFLVL